ncbi:MAG TPA: hypothetical protein VGV61_16390 [Thermoanaerobaculia bacterium]|jgi:type II secretory pathway pseudopilin PulG|nr:hypothetical protein [Thermoanaerobaculia bacterium]
MVTPAVPRDGGPVARRRGEAGYNLVLLMVAVMVLNILVAAAIPLWRTAIKREKEEELIFRGWQYAEAIRVFQRRFGRLPLRLGELVEVKPRCIRQLWVDPFTGKADWVPIRVVGPGGDPTMNQPPVDEGGGADGRQPSGTNVPDGNVGLGPIRGVRSRSTNKAIKKLFDQERYDHWQFTSDMLAQGGGGFGAPGQAGVTARQARFLGRPFRPGLSPGGMQAPPPQNPNPQRSPPPPPPPPPEE